MRRNFKKNYPFYMLHITTFFFNFYVRWIAKGLFYLLNINFFYTAANIIGCLLQDWCCLIHDYIQSSVYISNYKLDNFPFI